MITSGIIMTMFSALAHSFTGVFIKWAKELGFKPLNTELSWILQLFLL